MTVKGRRGPRQKTKVLVRNLPHNLKEETFREAIQEWIDKTDYYMYFPGKKSGQMYTNSLAYLNFKSADTLKAFKAKFEGTPFAASKKTELRCHIEYAPYSRIPKNKKKVDPKKGTIDKDPDFLKWEEERNAPAVPLTSADDQTQKATVFSGGEADGTEDKMPTTTPLLEHLKAKYVAKEAKMKAAKAAKAERDRHRKANSKGKTESRGRGGRSSGANGKGKQAPAPVQAKQILVNKNRAQNASSQTASTSSTSGPTLCKPPATASKSAGSSSRTGRSRKSSAGKTPGGQGSAKVSPSRSTGGGSQRGRKPINSSAMIMLRKQLETAGQNNGPSPGRNSAAKEISPSRTGRNCGGAVEGKGSERSRGGGPGRGRGGRGGHSPRERKGCSQAHPPASTST